MDIKKKKNDLKRIFVIFAIVLFVLTFISKSFYNYRLPVVMAELPKQGKLAFTVTGTSIFTYAYVESVYAKIDGWVKEILVEKGDEVKEGQSLIRFELSGSGEIYDVTASEDGIFTSVGVSKGMYVSSTQNKILYELAKKSDERICSLLISEEQMERIDKESIVTLDFVDRNETLKGTIKSIVSYASQDQEGYKVDIMVKMEDSSLIGERVNVTIREESTLYDTLIPATALCKDTAGYYVLTVQEDDSVLGAGHKAHRISVDLLDSDESYCAVRGLPTDEYVISASTNKIVDGSNVFYEGEDLS